MREIKFRAWEDWDKADTGMKSQLPKKMISWKEMVEWNRASLGDAISGDRGELILMQWTGLKDKNGKEIFEGDVLRRLGGTEEESKWEYFVVQIKEQRFAYPINRPEEWSDIFEDDEVIGNIYENPELLNLNSGRKNG